MKAIFKRELNAYFNSPIGYIFLAVMFGLCGYFFSTTSLTPNSTDLRPTFNAIFNLAIFLIPVLTMRLISEDKRQRTDQALLCAPISLSALVLGKLLSAVAVWASGVSITLVYAVVMQRFSPVEWPVVVGCYLGSLLLGTALISVGMLLSSLTENQVVAAVSTFAVLLVISQISYIASLVPVRWLSQLLARLSFLSYYKSFTLGLLSFTGFVFFLSVTGLFCFLTVRVFEKRRYA